MLSMILRLDEYKRLNPNELSVQQLINLEKEIKHRDPKTITDEYLDFELWCKGLQSRMLSQKGFNMITLEN